MSLKCTSEEDSLKKHSATSPFLTLEMRAHLVMDSLGVATAAEGM